MKYSSKLVKTPQTQVPVGRTDMVPNNAGGYGFKITPQQQLERFLLLGAEGGTFYASESKLTLENAHSIVAYIKTTGVGVVNTIIKFSEENRAPKADPMIFVLALVLTYGDPAAKKAAYAAVEKVARTGTQLFTLVGDIQNLGRGWSRGLRKAVAKFYLNRTPDQIAYQMVKYRQRNGFTHRDILRLSHPATKNKDINNLFKYAVGKLPGAESDQRLIMAFDFVMNSTDDKKMVEIIREHKLTWEMIPTEKLNNPEILGALLDHMPLTALIRNLNRFAMAGMTATNNETTKKIVAKLGDKEAIKKAGLHPVNVVNSMLTYSRGMGFRGSSTWTPNQNIVDALDGLFYATVDAVMPTGKNVLIGVDISGSMQTAISNTAMSAAQFANVLALTTLKVEPNAEVIAFAGRKAVWPLGRRSSLTEALKLPLPGGSTDCAIPIVHALETKTKYDAIIILTDNESWAGKQHAFQALAEYRKTINTDVKVIEVASVSTPYGTFPDDDKNLLRIVGFDASVLNVMENFIK